jgi:hypothetical protein
MSTYSILLRFPSAIRIVRHYHVDIPAILELSNPAVPDEREVPA